MKTAIIVTIGVVILAAVAVIVEVTHLVQKAPGVAAEPSDPTTTQASDSKGSVLVQTTPLIKGSITETIIAYGTVIPRSIDQETVSAHVESKVQRLLVAVGQTVRKDEDVAQVTASQDSRLQLLLAQNAVEAAKRDVAGAQERFNLKLATNQELQTSQNALRDAAVKLEDLQARGSAANQTLRAPRSGVVSKIDVTLGQIVPAGGSLMEIDDAGHLLARIGVEPRDALRLTNDTPVEISSVNGGEGKIAGKVTLITRRVNPDTRLVDVIASLPADCGLLLESPVRGTISVASEEGLLVPRAAVLPDGDGFSLFTVQDGKAVKHAVKIGLQTDAQMEVLEAKPTLKPGDAVVVVGNYELDDGVTVTQEQAP